MDPAVPAVEVTNDPHRPGAGRPYRERRAGRPLMHPHLRPEMVPQRLVPALAEQVEVELPERWPIPVRIVEHHHDTVRVGRLEAVVRDVRTLQHPREHPGGMHAAHLDTPPIGEDDHPDRVGTPPADHQTVVAVAVPFRVSAEDLVRIVVLTGDETLQVGAVHRQVELNRCAHAGSLRATLGESPDLSLLVWFRSQQTGTRTIPDRPVQRLFPG